MESLECFYIDGNTARLDGYYIEYVVLTVDMCRNSATALAVSCHNKCLCDPFPVFSGKRDRRGKLFCLPQQQNNNYFNGMYRIIPLLRLFAVDILKKDYRQK